MTTLLGIRENTETYVRVSNGSARLVIKILRHRASFFEIISRRIEAVLNDTGQPTRSVPGTKCGACTEKMYRSVA